MKDFISKYSMILAFIICLILLIVLSKYDQIIENFAHQKEFSNSGAYQALRFWTDSRAYPQKDIPPYKYLQEYEKEKNQLKKTENIIDIEPWESMGPYNVPGRMLSVAVNPQNSKTLYAGSASGGLWRTYNSTTGENWHRVSTGYPTLGVMAIAIDPLDTNVMYIGTGEVYGYQSSIGGTVIRVTRGSYGIGILKTIDGGNTWFKCLNWSVDQERGIQDIVLNPMNRNSLFAGTSEGLYKSVDAGETWKLSLDVLMVEDIIIQPNDSNKIMVSCGNLGSRGTGIYRSEDTGDSWSRLSGYPDYDGKTLLDMYRSDPNVVFASIADKESSIGLYRTDDFGNNWIEVHNHDVQKLQGFFSHWVAVHPTDKQNVVHAGVDIYHSSNGGQTLTKIPVRDCDHHNYARDPFDPDILYIALDQGVCRSTDFGETYSKIDRGLLTAQFYNGFSSSRSDSNLAIGGLQDNGNYLFTGDKQNWAHVLETDGGWTAIHPIYDNIIFCETQMNRIFKSINKGENFILSTTGLKGTPAFIAPFAIAPSNPEILYSARDIIFRSDNQGESWYETEGGVLDGNSAVSICISPSDEDIVYVGTAPTVNSAHIFKTTDGGKNWVDVTSNLPDRYPMDIAIDPIDNNIVYVVLGGFGSAHVYKTINGGSSWTNISHNLPDLPTSAIVIDPFRSDHLYLGNDLGVYSSQDGGNTWNNFFDGLPEAVIVSDLNISLSNRTLRAVTHGNGVYQRSLVHEVDFYVLQFPTNLPSVLIPNEKFSPGINLVNYGKSVQTEPIDLKIRLMDEMYSEIQTKDTTFCCIQGGGSKEVLFKDSFVLSDTGKYWIEFIRFANSVFPRDDTIRQQLTVIHPASICTSTVEKVSKPYIGLLPKNPLERGDDVHIKKNLPFDFSYDGNSYDKIQISSNGWVELGTGITGSRMGLSSTGMIINTTWNNNYLASIYRPSKVLAPWWDDLKVDESGQMIYEILGNSPNRIAAIEWQNILVDYQRATARVTFQLRLYEESNKIEFSYGNVENGTTGSASASIGLKDHIGGDYRFYDIAKGGPGSAYTLVNLNPLNDWPGENTAYIIEMEPTSVDDDYVSFSEKYTLHQNYPNPFNPSTTIKYTIPIDEKRKTFTPQNAEKNVKLVVYDLIGQTVQTLVDEKQKPGGYEIEFNGSKISSGIYFYRLHAGDFVETKKMLMIK